MKACRYFVNHYDELTLFCKEAEVPIDNNTMEEGLKVKIRTRKMSLYYRTQVGADVANVLTSVIATAYRNNCNAFEYLNRIQSNREAVKIDAKDWLPWGRRAIDNQDSERPVAEHEPETQSTLEINSS